MFSGGTVSLENSRSLTAVSVVYTEGQTYGFGVYPAFVRRIHARESVVFTVNRYRRDGLLALVTLTLLAAVSIRAGVTERLFDLAVAGVGLLGMCTLEAVLLRYPDWTRAVWERRSVRSVAVLGTVAVGFVATGTGVSGLVLGALVWGLVGYLLLLVVVVCYENPIARLVGR